MDDDDFLDRQKRRFAALEDAYDALTPPETDLVIARRLRIVMGFTRAVKQMRELEQMKPAEAPQEDDGESMGLRHDPETVERKHRELDEGLARLARNLELRRAAGAADRGGAGSRADQLAEPRQPRAA